MKPLILALVLLLSINSFAQEATTYFFIRHAEKDRSDSSNKNPNLTDQGKQRAIYWSHVFNEIAFDAVYATNYNRTIQTATPTAKKNGLKVLFYNPKDLYNKAFQSETKGKTVLIVGHSNTTPTFVNTILGKEKYKQIEDNNNSNLYIVSILKDTVSDILLKIEHKKNH